MKNEKVYSQALRWMCLTTLYIPLTFGHLPESKHTLVEGRAVESTELHGIPLPLLTLLTELHKVACKRERECVRVLKTAQKAKDVSHHGTG